MADVQALDMDVVTEKSNHQVVGMAVSVCITPAAPSPLPIPYPLVATVSDGITDSPLRTKVCGVNCATIGSVLTACHGNEAGTLKEVVSLNTAGPVAPITGAFTVLIELGPAAITGSLADMNKAPTPGAGSNASDAGGAGGGGGAGGASGGAGGGPTGPEGPSTSSGSGSGGSSAAASATQPLHGQEQPMSCGIAASRMVIHSRTGADPGEAGLRAQSAAAGPAAGGYDPVNGTRMDNVQTVLQNNGVPTATMRNNQSVADLQAATAGGNPAIIHVANPDGSGHAMVVDGVTTDPNGVRQVAVRDPGPVGTGTQSTMSEQDLQNRGYSGWAVTTN